MVLRRGVRRSTRAARPKRKVVFARFSQSGGNIPAGTVQAFNPLSDFETQYGAQAVGATIVGLRGNGMFRNRGSVTSTTQFCSYGFIVLKNELADLAANHPSPSFATANNDKYSSWMWIEEIPVAPALSTPVSGQSTQDNVNFAFATRNKRKLAQLEDQLVFAVATQAGGGTIDYGFSFSVAIALP